MIEKNCFQEEEKMPENSYCKKITYQSAMVSLPVTIEPSACAGIPCTFCREDPRITPLDCSLKCNKVNGRCSYVISQNICIEVPIEFGAKVFTGNPHVECGCAGSCEDRDDEKDCNRCKVCEDCND